MEVPPLRNKKNNELDNEWLNQFNVNEEVYSDNHDKPHMIVLAINDNILKLQD